MKYPVKNLSLCKLSGAWYNYLDDEFDSFFDAVRVILCNHTILFE